MGTEYYLGLLIISAMLEGIMASDEKIDESAVPHSRQKRLTAPVLLNQHNLHLDNPTRVLITCDEETIQIGYAIHSSIVVTWAQAFYKGYHPALKVSEKVQFENHFLRHQIRHNIPHPSFIPHQGHEDNDVTVLEIFGEIHLLENAHGKLAQRFGPYIRNFILPRANELIEARAG